MFWFLLFIVFAGFLIGVTVWSQVILMRQKKAWETFARKHKLAFRKGTFMGPAEVSGNINGYSVNFYTAERQVQDMRNRRYVSVVEIDINDGVFDSAVAGTKEMQPFMQTLDLLHFYSVSKEGWNLDHQIYVKNDTVAAAYFTPARIETFENILKTKNADVLLVLNAQQIVLRLETSDPMQDADKLDKIVMRQIALADRVRISAEERAKLAQTGVAAAAPPIVAPPETPAAP